MAAVANTERHIAGGDETGSSWWENECCETPQHKLILKYSRINMEGNNKNESK